MELSGNDEAATRCLMGCPKSGSGKSWFKGVGRSNE